MSRGRQKRVEKAEARRQESRKKKDRKGTKSLYKTMIQNQLFPFLDRFNLEKLILKREKFHMWVDTLPLSRRRDEDNFDEDEGKISKKNKKKNSIGDASPTAKKAHPRSHDNAEDNIDAEEEKPLLCHRHFFTGECQGLKSSKSKKNGPSCPHTHYSSKKQMTLADVMIQSKKYAQSTGLASNNLSNDENTCDDVLKQASNAAIVAQMKADGTVGNEMYQHKIEGIDMLHHIEVIFTSTSLDKEMEVSELISKSLISEEVPIGGIAYVVYNNILLFDRYDSGKVLNAETEEMIFSNEVLENTENDSNNNKKSVGITKFPSPVLEHITRYLPDSYSGTLPMVCKTFYNEIGTSSPALWKALLMRHDWPVNRSTGENCNVTTHRESFVQHYRVCHRVEALKNGIDRVMYSDSDNHRVIMTKFSRNHDSPTDYRSLSFWDENSVLVASRNDCMLRLFKVSKQKSTIECKQVLGTRVAPLRSSRKTRCSLESMAVDDRYIFCSYVIDGVCMVASMMRDSLLTNSMEESIESGNVLRCHELTSVFLEYYGCNLGTSEFEFLEGLRSDDDDIIIDVHVSMVGDVHACGNSVFCAIVKIWHEICHDDTDSTQVIELRTGLLTFTASAGRKLVLDFVQNSALLPTDFKPYLCTNYHRKKRSEPTEIVCKNIFTLEVFTTLVDRNGIFQKNYRFHSWSAFDLVDMLNRQFEGSRFFIDHPNVQSLINRSHIVTSYLLLHSESTSRRVSVVFQELKPSSLDTTPSIMLLRNRYKKILSMKCMEEDYLILICVCYTSPVAPEEDIDGNWFCSSEEKGGKIKDVIDLVVIHMPSMTEMHSTTVRSSKVSVDEIRFPMLVDISKKGTVAALVEDIGMCITGAALADIVKDDNKVSKMKRVKTKKRLVAKTGNGGKKQGTGLVKL